MSENVNLSKRHAALFEEVRDHNYAVMRRRRAGGDWEAPENKYRDAFAEARVREVLA